ncbi:LOW QUALITY PROTEIN: attractin-like [Elysia marginata]|uniref:Attractin-like n=1 Tax=Elysia marginata TaxID=1093978 RepID=A0AAV4J8R3_9GAST|nr:LOW QUALITY PROTEIN: attractin-like [Elysia marginata]
MKAKISCDFENDMHFSTLSSEIYFFGGFNSVVKNDLYKILPGNCSYFIERKHCDQSFPGMKCTWKAGRCEMVQKGEKKCDHEDSNAQCSGYNTCASCLGSSLCVWCDKACVSSHPNSENCSKDTTKCSKETSCGVFQNCRSCQGEKECFWHESRCKERQPKNCAEHKTCLDCRTEEQCGWCSNPNETNRGSCMDVKKADSTLPPDSCEKEQWFHDQCPGAKIKLSDICDKPCSAYTSCANCTNAKCMWCSNPSQCIDTNSYVASFHYGQCMDWTTQKNTCKESDCNQHKSCTECQANPKCGWCNDEADTGIGRCYDGSMTGPISHTSKGYSVDSSICPSERWYFNDCPKCQCNGHSSCFNNTSTCKSCEHPTTGPQCQFCANGFYGVPKHGASCKACTCNDQADTCDHVTGACFCRTRGVIGMNCSSCDDKNKYTGNPKNGGTCYYRLTTDFQYTFNLSKPEDQNYTTINFLNTPTSSDRDVDFTLNCSTQAFVNITYKSKSFPKETEYVSGRLCDFFRTKFEHKKHAFGGSENTTFMVGRVVAVVVVVSSRRGGGLVIVVVIVVDGGGGLVVVVVVVVVVVIVVVVVVVVVGGGGLVVVVVVEVVVVVLVVAEEVIVAVVVVVVVVVIVIVAVVIVVLMVVVVAAAVVVVVVVIVMVVEVAVILVALSLF